MTLWSSSLTVLGKNFSFGTEGVSLRCKQLYWFSYTNFCYSRTLVQSRKSRMGNFSKQFAKFIKIHLTFCFSPTRCIRADRKCNVLERIENRSCVNATSCYVLILCNRFQPLYTWLYLHSVCLQSKFLTPFQITRKWGEDGGFCRYYCW